MDPQLPPYTHIGDHQPGESRKDHVARRISYADALALADEVQDGSTGNCELRSNKKEAEDEFTRENEQESNADGPCIVQHSQGDPLSRSVSQETEPSFSSSTKKAPSRAVFEDLPTAYLCITSGIAKSRSQNGSSSFLAAYLEEEPVPPQARLRQTNVSGNFYESEQLSPIPGPSCRLINCNTLDHTLSDEENKGSPVQHIAQEVPIDSEIQGQTAISLVSVGNQLAREFSTDTRDNESGLSTSVPSPQKSSDLDATHGAPNPPRRKTVNAVIENDMLTLANKNTTPQTTSGHNPWVAEESTVGNIYRHYASSSINGGESENSTPRQHPRSGSQAQLSPNNDMLFISQSDGEAKPSALNVRKQRRVDRLMSGPQSRPPSYALPAVPTSSLNRFPSSASQGLGQSSSYGDTRNLLEVAPRPILTVPKPTLSRSEARTDLRLQRSALDLGDTIEPSATTSSSNNPFRPSYCPQVITSRDCYVDCTYDDGQSLEVISGDRQPLEREVSNALRRASGFSVFSSGSVCTSLLEDEHFEPSASSFKRTGFNRRTTIKDTPPSEAQNSSKGSKKVASHAQGFYDERAIPLSWITPHQKNAVRVPINQKDTFPKSLPESSAEPSGLPLEHRDDSETNDIEGDSNDWETVGESRFEADFKESQGRGGLFEVSTIHRTGSSLANTSNDGMSLNDADTDDYGSTERITQHAGIIQYSGDYRQQDLNKTPTPVFPAIYREHKVNGYLAGLTRHHPPSSPFNQAPQPLQNLHTNPFRSPPPEDLSTPTARRMLFQNRNQRGRKPNHFPPSMKTVDTLDNNDTTGQRTRSISSSLTPTTVAERERTYRTLNWNAELSYPSPTLSHSKRQYLSPINPVGRPDRPSSWRHLMVFGRGDTIEGYNADGTPESTSTAPLSDPSESNWHSRMQAAGFIELRKLPEDKSSTSNGDQQPLVKRPPGAFYQGITRSQQDGNAGGSSDTQRRSTKAVPRYATPRHYPTNVLRPLSLLGNGPVTPDENESKDHLPIRNKSGRIHRSPHAPPRRLSWQQLYTEAQLQSMQEAGTADSMHDVSLVSDPRNSDQGMGDHPSRRRFYGDVAFNQRLSSWTQETSARMDRRDNKSKFSTLVLFSCALFPPLLVMFAFGRLDRLIAWWSKGELSAFEDKQKKLAQILISVWGFIIFVGLIILLVFRFAPPGTSS